MPKALLRRYMPDPDKILASKSLGFLGDRLRDPSIWHLNRRSASGAVFWGLFCAFLPMPLQMIPAALGVLAFRINLPLTILLVWLTNPLTWLPCMYIAYEVGSWVTGAASLSFGEVAQVLERVSSLFAGGLDSVSAPAHRSLNIYLQTFLIGSLLVGTTLGTTGYVLMRLYWRWHVVSAWRARAARRRAGDS